MAVAASTTGTSTGTADADTSRVARQDRPSALLVMPLRAAEQHVLVVVGEADLYTAGELRALLMESIRAEPPSVLVELGALEFCDLHGLDALHDAARAAHDAGVALTFRGMSAQLSWLHQTFPPRNPVPPPFTGRLQTTPCPSTPAAGPSGTAASAPGQPAARNASTPRTPGNPSRTGRGPSPTSPAADARRSARSADHPADQPGRAADGPSGYLTGRGGRRRGAADDVVHAVPISDSTRSAVCGTRIWPAKVPWIAEAAGSCPDCIDAIAAASAVGTVHPLPASLTTVSSERQAHDPTPARQVS